MNGPPDERRVVLYGLKPFALLVAEQLTNPSRNPGHDLADVHELALRVAHPQTVEVLLLDRSGHLGQPTRLHDVGAKTHFLGADTSCPTTQATMCAT